MDIHPSKENALLEWINGLQLGEPVERIAQLQDGCLLLKLVYKLKGEEPSQAPVHLPPTERISIVSDFVRNVCQQCAPLSLDNSSSGKDLVLAKVVLLLCYYGFINKGMMSSVEFKAELQMVAMFRYVQGEANSLSLCDGLDRILTMSSLINCPSSSSVSSLTEDGSPIFARSSSSPLVNFLELNTVASSSFVGSPIQEIMNTPQVQLKRLRKELAREGDVRDELEQELAERTSALSEKEGQISQLQHRLQRLLRDQEELEKDHKVTLTELQEKNEGLLKRVHEVLKQCQDLKTDNNQKEKRIDELTEENGTLAAQIRSTFAQLASAEEELTKVTEAHEMSQVEWGSRRDSLQKELSQALADRECLSEQIQILQGKISVLEDELSKLSVQLQEKGEVLGPIVEWERLKQDLADLTLQHSQLEENISCLEKEKLEIEMLLAEERHSFERETLRMEGVISDLQDTVNSIRVEREAQEQASRENQQILTARISCLETDLAHLHQLEAQLMAEVAITAELRKQREKLEAQVATLEGLVHELQTKCQAVGAENKSQQEALCALRADLQVAQVSLVEYEEKLADHQSVVEENASLRARISALDDTIVLLQNEVDRERKRSEEVLLAKEQHKALMEERFQEQEKKAHEMFVELETLSQELHKMKQQKLHAESCMEKLTQEGRVLAASLSEQRDLAQSQLELVKKAKDESEVELQRIITEHQSKISELQCEIKGNVESLMQSECELCVLKEQISSSDIQLVDQQQKLVNLQCERENLLEQLMEQERSSEQLSQNVTSKDMKIQQLKGELELKEGEIQSLKVSIQSMQATSSEMHNIHQREVENQKLVISELKVQLTDAERLASEKVKALDDLIQHLKNLKEELSIERQKVTTLHKDVEDSKEAHEAQQRALKLEASQLQQEINENLKNLEGFMAQIKSLKEQFNCQRDITLEKEREASILGAKHNALEENFAQLQNKLEVVTVLAKERESELLVLREEMGQKENLRGKAQEVEEIQRKKLEREVIELQHQVHDLTDLASEKESLLCSLNEKMKEQQEVNQKLLQQSEKALHRELEKIVELKGQLDSATHKVMAKTDVLKSMQEKIKQMEFLCQQKETLASEACQAKETLERKVTELCTKQNQELDQYVQQLETLKNEKEHHSSLSQSFQNECQNLRAENVVQQEAVNVLKADLQKMQDVYQQELEALKEKEKHLSSMNQTLQSECQGLQTENQGQQEALNSLRADLRNTLDRHQKEVETLQKEKEHVSLEHQCLQNDYQSLQEKNKEQHETLNLLQVDLENNQERYQQDLETLKKEKEQLTTESQSFQNECQILQVKISENQDTVNVLKADLQNTQTKFQKDLRTLQEEKDDLFSVNQSLQSECQSLQTENKEQQQALNAVKFDLQSNLDQHHKDVDSLQKEKEHILSMCETLQNECHSLQEKNKEQHEILTAVKVDLQNAQEGQQQELESFQREKEHLSSVYQSLQNEFQSLQTESKGQQEALISLKAHLQNTQEEYQQQLETLKNEKEHLSSLNQSLQSKFQSLQTEHEREQDALSTLKADLQKSLDKHQKEIETLQKGKEHLTLVNQSLLEDCEAARKLSAELGKAKEAAQQREKELETQVEELQVKVKEISTLAAKRETDLENLEQKMRQQEALRISSQESENSLRTELETKVAQLQVQVEKAHELSSERKSEMNMLLSEIEECEKQKREACQAKEVLERAVTELHIRQKQEQDGYHQELNTLKKEKDHITSINQSIQKECQSLQEKSKVQQEALACLKNARRELQQEMETLKKENEQFSSLNQSLQRECDASQRIGTELEMKLEERNEFIRALKEAAQENKKQNQELQEQLKLKSEVVEHYKAQVEKAKIHYDDKKQQLVEEQDARQALQAFLEASKSEVKALKSELKLATMELDNAKMSEKSLMAKVKSLEAQVDHAGRQLRELKKHANQNAQVRHGGSAPTLNVPEEVQNVSADSLEHDLDNSLSPTGKLSVPEESSTPRSSERLAAKRRAQERGSLETLYFTPMNPRSRKHHDVKQQCKLESSLTSHISGDLTLDSAKKPTSSARRRYTTQVINITMAKTSPGGGAGGADESFYSLHTAQSQPCLASQKPRPVSMEILEQPNMANSNDKLLGLPGYRRSNVHSNPPTRASSTFCVGTENEPDHMADDWMRIAELQTRNKACLPHLKSSYALESRPSLGFTRLAITDEDVRTGDPDDTIRRASMIPGQLTESLSSHRLSLALPMAPRSHAPSQRASMLPGQISASAAAQRPAPPPRGSSRTHQARSARSPLAPKRPAGQLQDPDTPEAKKLASCFPRPATPKGRTLRSTSSNSENNPAASSSDRRQSMAFVIDNTPKKSGRGDSRLQRGINKLRNSARKSPASTSRSARSGAGAAHGRSPLVNRPQAKSPRTASTKSPKVPTSAKKLMKFRMKV